MENKITGKIRNREDKKLGRKENGKKENWEERNWEEKKLGRK